MKKTDAPVVVEETFKTSIGSLWKAITEVGQMRLWFFDNIPSFQPEVGFETEFDVESQDRIFPHKWEVLEVDPPSKLKYRWRFGGYPGDSFVCWELSEHGDSTKLRLTAQVLEDFPEEIPEFRRESCVGGWNYFLGKSLKDYLEGKP